MTNTPSFYLRGQRLATVFACAFGLAHAAQGQDALRAAVAGDQSYQARNSETYVPEQHRLHAGPVEFQAGVSYTLDWNDNIFLRPDNQEDDFIHRPQFDLRALWQVTEQSRIGFGAGIGYQAYMDHPDLGGLVVTPDSEFAWDIRVKDFVFTLYDRVSYSQDVLSQGTISSGTAEFSRVENRAGLRVRWYPSRYVFELGYGHFNFFSVSDSSTNFSHLDRSAEELFGRAGVRFAEVTMAGIEASATFTDYESPVQSDNVSVSVGPFVEWQTTEAFSLSLRGGLVFSSFDSSLSRPTDEDLNSYFVGLGATHQLTDHIAHGLSLSRSVQQGLNLGSDHIEQLSTRYFVNWGFHRSASISANCFYENNNEPQGGVDNRSDRFGAGLGLSLSPLDHLQVGLTYNVTTRNSDLPANDYDQNSISASISYQF